MSNWQWRPWLRLAQFGVTICLMGWLLSQVAWSALLPLFANVRWGFVIAGIGCLVICHLINIVRWGYLLEQHNVDFRTLLVLYGAGLFSNNFLPTGIGGDGVRAMLLGRIVSPGRAILSVTLDRGIGLLALMTFLIPGLWAGAPPVLDTVGRLLNPAFSNTRVILLILAAICTLALAGAAAWRRSPGLQGMLVGLSARLLQRWDFPQWTIGQWLRLFFGSYLLSVFSNLGLVVATSFMLQALWVIPPPVAALWLVLLASLSLLFPLAVNGMGVVEGVYVAVLSGYGVPVSIALSCALLMRLAGLLLSLVGGLTLLQQRVPIVIEAQPDGDASALRVSLQRGQNE